MKQNAQVIVEQIEGRTMFSAGVADNVLYVRGTEGVDKIVVTQLKDNSVVVNDNGKKTTFAAWSFNTINVETGAGDDAVTLDGVILPGGGSVLTYGGKDSVFLNNINVSKDFYVETGVDADTAVVTNGIINGGTLNTGDGNDFVFGYGNTIWNYGTIQTGAGNDSVIVAKTSTYGYTTIDTGSGFDLFIGYRNNFAGGSSINAELKIVI